MEKVLVVEDDSTWQRLHKRRLEQFLGEGYVDVADSYDVALSMLNQSYAAYIVDGEFPRSQGGTPKPWGVPFAQEIYERDGHYDKVFMVSGNPDIWKQAQNTGVTKIYTTGVADETAKVGDLMKLIYDLRSLLRK